MKQKLLLILGVVLLLATAITIMTPAPVQAREVCASVQMNLYETRHDGYCDNDYFNCVHVEVVVVCPS